MAEARREGCHPYRAPGYDRFMERLGSAGHDLPPDLARKWSEELPGLDARDREIRKGVREVTEFVARRREIIDRAARRRPDSPLGKGRVSAYGRWTRSAPKMIERGERLARDPLLTPDDRKTLEKALARLHAAPDSDALDAREPQGLGGDPRQGGGAGMPPLLRRRLRGLRQGTGRRPERDTRVQQVRGRRKVRALGHAGRAGAYPVRRPPSRQGAQGAERGRRGSSWREDASLSEVETRGRANRRGAPGRPLRQGTLRPASCPGSGAGKAAARDGGGGLGHDQARRAGPEGGRGGIQDRTMEFEREMTRKREQELERIHGPSRYMGAEIDIGR